MKTFLCVLAAVSSIHALPMRRAEKTNLDQSSSNEAFRSHEVQFMADPTFERLQKMMAHKGRPSTSSAAREQIVGAVQAEQEDVHDDNWTSNDEASQHASFWDALSPLGSGFASAPPDLLESSSSLPLDGNEEELIHDEVSLMTPASSRQAMRTKRERRRQGEVRVGRPPIPLDPWMMSQPYEQYLEIYREYKLYEPKLPSRLLKSRIQHFCSEQVKNDLFSEDDERIDRALATLSQNATGFTKLPRGTLAPLIEKLAEAWSVDKVKARARLMRIRKKDPGVLARFENDFDTYFSFWTHQLRLKPSSTGEEEEGRGDEDDEEPHHSPGGTFSF